MAINETKIIVKAVDEATPVFNKIGAGAKGVGNAMDEVGRKAGGLTNYIKEQRKEGRQHSFIIGEMKDTLAVAGLAMNMFASSAAEGNSQFKKINDSVSKGIIAFMGLDAIVSALSKTFKSFGGWVGMAVTAIGAITFALVDYFKANDEANKSTEKSITAHDRVVERLKEALSIYERLDSVKKQSAFKDKATTEENIKQLKQWIDADKIKLDQIATNKEISAGFAIQEQSRLGKQIEYNKELLKLAEEDFKSILKTEDLESKIADARKKRFNFIVTEIQKITNIKPLIEVQAVLKPIKKLGFEIPKVDVPQIDPLGDFFKEEDRKQTEFELAMDSLSQAVNVFQGFSNNAFEERMNNYDRELDKLNQFYATSAEKINADYNARIAAAQGNAELENALEEEKKAKLLKIEEEKLAAQLVIEEKIKAEKRKNFIANQNAAVVQAIIDTASAVVEALPDPFKVAWAGAMGLAQIALIKSQPVPNFHTGGGMFFNAPADREMPVMVRGQETIRVTTPQQERNKNNGGVIINFNSPVSDVEFIKKSIKKVLNQTGLKIENAFVNNRNKVSFA